ncbi:acetylglutamate kinase [Croceitalea rosinachiae]|uniref:Acetylglutamate kinase n=1 Tax=Croceitalea rosinachiae TaxID=3075596 RepID=A0ABU3A953_9FLAO|nr:acetylglutamate kinase [Croceitalea sp. F388]MDT0606715.1 acetylglutamate kinase [Croceitalea sp. F388]
MKQQLSIIKIGGNIIENDAELLKFLTLFSQMTTPKILVHGGGKKANQVLQKMGIIPKMVNGRRITDAASLDVAIMVYGGLTNKKIVAKLQSLHCNAIGMSGADANAIQAHKRPVKDIDYGFAGDIDNINSDLIANLLNLNITPVFCALTHNQKGQLLNTNADTIVSELAIGMSVTFETTLYYCFELNGVLRDFQNKNSVLKNIDSDSYKALIAEGIISEGMLPKLHNCFHALKNGVKEVRIGNLALFDNVNTNYTTLVL